VTEELHCGNCSGTYDPDSGDYLDDRECVCCECCCTCLSCEYGPRDGLLMFPEESK
jgi:hypothetical protein